MLILNNLNYDSRIQSKTLFFLSLSILEITDMEDFYFILSIAKMDHKIMICSLFILQYSCEYIIKSFSNGF